MAIAAAVLALNACAGKAGGRSDASTGGSGAVSTGGSAAGNAGVAGVAVGGSGSGGAFGGGAGSGAGSSGAGSDGAGSGGQAEVACPEAPVPSRTTGTLVEVSTEFTLGGEPMEFGEPNPIEGGRTLIPLDVRFYVSEVSLVRPDSTTVSVDIVGDTGAPIPYGIKLVNAEDSASLRFRLLAPAGSYSGLSFTLGVSDACNSGFPGSGPLSAASGMTWPHGFGYLFLRYAGSVVPADGGAPLPDGGAEESDPPGAIHMGGLQGTLLAPRVQARGDITVDASTPTSRRMAFDLDELFRATTCSLDPATFPGPPDREVLLGECVRQLAPERPLFTLSPP